MRLRLLFLVLSLALTAAACGGDDDDNDNANPGDDDDNDNDASPADDDDDDNDNDSSPADDDDDTDPGDPIEPTAGFLARQAEYLAACSASPTGSNEMVCHAYIGDTTYDEGAIQASLDEIVNREDTADFGLNAILRMLYFDRANPALPDALRTDMENAVINFKYWLDEPGPDMMCWWSENHQILVHTAELIAGQLFPETVFPNSGLTGQQHMNHAGPMIHRWLDMRGLFGYSEFHSNVYFNEDMPALLNLVDFSPDPAMAAKAAMALDVIAFDFGMNYYKGLFATTHGRTYQDHLLDNLHDSTTEQAWIMLGLGDWESAGSFTGVFLATSDKYWPPAILEHVAADALADIEHKQRDSVNIADGPSFGINYESWDDIMFWWGATGYAAPDIITGTFNLVDYFDLWDNYLFSDIAFLKLLVGSPLLRAFAELYEPMSQGVALEAVGTYTYRTPHYQLSGAQDFKPANWSAQVHIWQATIDQEAYVFTTYPGGLEGDYMAGPWTGGWQPRGTFYRNVGIMQYWRPKLPLVDQLLFVNYTHAYFPKTKFDELVEAGHWTIGRKGDAYVALYSQNATEWSADNDYELIADGKENVWIVELGDADNSGSFAEFVADIEAAYVTVSGQVYYESPSQGVISVGRTGPMIIEDEIADLGPYPRWDNAYCQQEYGTSVTDINFNGERLNLDFPNARRRYWSGE
jgi:hypothetical protein